MILNGTYSRRNLIGLLAGMTAAIALEPSSYQAFAEGNSDTAGPRCVALSRDGKFLAAPVRNKGIAIFDYQKGERLRLLEVPSGVRVESLAFSGNGEKPNSAGILLAAGCSDGAAVIWDATTGKKQGVISAHKGSVTSIVFSSDGKTLFTASSDESHIKFWDAATRTPLNDVTAHPIGVRSLALSEDGMTLASGGAGLNPAIHLWDVSNPAKTKRFSSYLRGGHDLSIAALAFSPNGKQLMSGSWDKTVQVWNLAERKSVMVFKGHAAEVLAVAWLPDGARSISAGLDKTVRLWDSTTGKEIKSLGKNTAPVYGIAVARDGKTVVTAGEDGITNFKLSAE